MGCHFPPELLSDEINEKEEWYKNKITQDLGFKGIEVKVLPYGVAIHADVAFVNSSDELDTEQFVSWRKDLHNSQFINDYNGKITVKREVEKMSKSKYNVVKSGCYLRGIWRRFFAPCTRCF